MIDSFDRTAYDLSVSNVCVSNAGSSFDYEESTEFSLYYM